MAGAWDVVADALGFGGPSGDDHGSSNWAAWGHPEIRSMLDHSVDPGDIGDAASAWRALGRDAGDLVSGRTRELNAMVAGGWRGAAADAAIAPLARIGQWSASVAGTAERTTALMEAAGSSAAQAKAAVPPPKAHDWGESLRSFSVGGVSGAFIDAVAQEQEQSDAHAEAVRIMTNVYSAPINDHRAAVPTYPQLVDPTVQAPDQPLTAAPVSGGPAPVPQYSVSPYSAHLSSAAGTAGAGAGGPGGGHGTHQPPTAAALQGLTSAGAGAAVPADQATYRPQHLGGQSAAAAGVPITAPLAGGGAARRPRVAGNGARPGGARAAGVHGGGVHASGVHGGGYLGGARAGGGHPADFGPRPPGAAAGAAEGRAGTGLGRGSSGAGAGRGGAGEMLAPMSGARGKGGEDSEHRRPSYLIEMDDIFTDGRKVAPAVIGQDPPD